MTMERDSRKSAMMAALLCVLIGFLAWWWWPRPAAVETVQPAPLPKGIAERPPPAPNAELGAFEEVKLPNGETGLLPRLTLGQADQLKKTGKMTLRVPGGGLISISQPDKRAEEEKD
jgi:hypothetical protein